jgi:hypothetical protein
MTQPVFKHDLWLVTTYGGRGERLLLMRGDLDLELAGLSPRPRCSESAYVCSLMMKDRVKGRGEWRRKKQALNRSAEHHVQSPLTKDIL